MSRSFVPFHRKYAQSVSDQRKSTTNSLSHKHTNARTHTHIHEWVSERTRTHIHICIWQRYPSTTTTTGTASAAAETVLTTIVWWVRATTRHVKLIHIEIKHTQTSLFALWLFTDLFVYVSTIAIRVQKPKQKKNTENHNCVPFRSYVHFIFRSMCSSNCIALPQFIQKNNPSADKFGYDPAMSFCCCCCPFRFCADCFSTKFFRYYSTFLSSSHNKLRMWIIIFMIIIILLLLLLLLVAINLIYCGCVTGNGTLYSVLNENPHSLTPSSPHQSISAPVSFIQISMQIQPNESIVL